jgi:hypothetical protein
MAHIIQSPAFRLFSRACFRAVAEQEFDPKFQKASSVVKLVNLWSRNLRWLSSETNLGNFADGLHNLRRCQPLSMSYDEDFARRARHCRYYWICPYCHIRQNTTKLMHAMRYFQLQQGKAASKLIWCLFSCENNLNKRYKDRRVAYEFALRDASKELWRGLQNADIEAFAYFASLKAIKFGPNLPLQLSCLFPAPVNFLADGYTKFKDSLLTFLVRITPVNWTLTSCRYYDYKMPSLISAASLAAPVPKIWFANNPVAINQALHLRAPVTSLEQLFPAYDIIQSVKCWSGYFGGLRVGKAAQQNSKKKWKEFDGVDTQLEYEHLDDLEWR